jgi:hypothetical protein
MTDLHDVGAGSDPAAQARSRLADWNLPADEKEDGGVRHSAAALRRENQDLRDALASQPVIDQAKGALMLRYRLDPDSAFGLMVRWSQASHIKVRDIAQALVESIVAGDVEHADPVLCRELEQVLQQGRGEPQA